MNIGDHVGHHAFSATNIPDGKLADFQDQWLVLYFYPKDATPGCTIEGQNFRDLYQEFQALNADVLGASKDTLEKHKKFKSKQNFPFELISDPDGNLCEAFDVMKSKSMFGKSFLGIERCTFLIDPTSTIRKVWRTVKVKNHAQEVVDTLKLLQKNNS